MPSEHSVSKWINNLSRDKSQSCDQGKRTAWPAWIKMTDKNSKNRERNKSVPDQKRP